MPQNQLKVEHLAGQDLEVTIFDADGVAHDITAMFRSITGSTTPSAFANRFTGQRDGTSIDITFTARGKEMAFDVNEATVKQLCALV